VIADATTSDGNAAQRYTDVVDWRSAGGSWGVTLGLLSGEVSKVESKLSALQHGQPAGQIGTPASVQAFGRPTIGGGGGGTPHPGHTNHPTHPTSPPPTKDPGGGTPTPKPTKGAVGQAVDTVDGVVSKVIGLLPKKLLPLPKPHPSSSPGLLGSLLGH
jgi:hypothetical protein